MNTTVSTRGTASVSHRSAATAPLVLADFGSTYTKVTVVDTCDGRLVATARHPTTLESDVLDGLDRSLAALEPSVPGIAEASVWACSSAGGGLRVAVIGLERDLTAEAARLAALSAGARVDTVLAGRVPALDELIAEPPDIVLLTGGTDGGDARGILAAAEALAGSVLDVPIVVAGNAESQADAEATLRAAGKRVTRAPNVMPEIGVTACDGARDIIRQQFLRHVIGGKHLSEGSRFIDMLRMATPDAVLSGVELLARGRAGHAGLGPVVVLDVGGATTDVHSVTAHDPGGDGMERPLLPQPDVMRTVEGDLGLRWNAPGIVAAARTANLLSVHEADELAEPVALRAADPSFTPDSKTERRIDVRLAGLAARLALLRHAGRISITLSTAGASVRRQGRDLRAIPRVVGTGGVFEHGDREQLADTVALACGPADGRLLPRPREVLADRCYLLAAAGLLAGDHPELAVRLLDDHLMPLWPSGEDRAHD